jgi:hypothetical protein
MKEKEKKISISSLERIADALERELKKLREKIS